jgi:hypothetical protein
MTMAGKCEHGLTTRECMACASPKYGAKTGDRWVTIPRARLAELEAVELQVKEGETLAQYEGDNERRQWASTGTWLYRGDRIVVLRANAELTGQGGA